jgi:hypothetical protein
MNLPTYLRTLRQHFGVWPVVDTLAHKLHIRGRVGRFICYKADLAFGLTESEARS